MMNCLNVERKNQIQLDTVSDKNPRAENKSIPFDADIQHIKVRQQQQFKRNSKVHLIQIPHRNDPYSHYYSDLN